MAKFIGVDGESYSDEDGHRYILLANSFGQYEYNPKGIPTTECLDFILRMPKSKNQVYVAFGWNYDVSMILRDMPEPKLRELRTKQRIKWEGYELEWIPSKWFHVSKDGEHRRIHEVLGFFQQKFVEALKDWGIDPPLSMEAMKEARSDFTEAMKDDIIRYCVSECNLLSELMGKLDYALKSVGLRPSNWIGAGSIAAALLRNHNVLDSHQYDVAFGKQAQLAFLTAYFGGRVELFKQGSFSKLYDYDIVSAYPTSAQHLPSLTGAKAKVHDGYVKSPYAVYLLNWEGIEDTPLMPFPVRYSGGSICYPSNGRGWYHTPEVELALKHYPEHITIEKSLVLTIKDPTKPFRFIPEVFKHRAKLKSEGHPGQKALKLGLNSLYGKLAQGVGYKDNLPPFQSYYWAGRITSETRARAIAIGMKKPDALVMIATDGIFFDQPIDIPTGKGLGDIECEVLTDTFVAQAGVYSATPENGKRYGKCRGFFSHEIDFDKLEAGYHQDSFHHEAEYSTTRFIGLITALHTNSLDKWRTWHTAMRKLRLHPSKKFPRGHAPTIHFPPTLNVDCSQPYVPKGGTHVFPSDIDPLEFLQGSEQPIRDTQ